MGDQPIRAMADWRWRTAADRADAIALDDVIARELAAALDAPRNAAAAALYRLPTPPAPRPAALPDERPRIRYAPGTDPCELAPPMRHNAVWMPGRPYTRGPGPSVADVQRFLGVDPAHPARLTILDLPMRPDLTMPPDTFRIVGNPRTGPFTVDPVERPTPGQVWRDMQGIVETASDNLVREIERRIAETVNATWAAPEPDDAPLDVYECIRRARELIDRHDIELTIEPDPVVTEPLAWRSESYSISVEAHLRFRFRTRPADDPPPPGIADVT